MSPNLTKLKKVKTRSLLNANFDNLYAAVSFTLRGYTDRNTDIPALSASGYSKCYN